MPESHGCSAMLSRLREGGEKPFLPQPQDIGFNKFNNTKYWVYITKKRQGQRYFRFARKYHDLIETHRSYLWSIGVVCGLLMTLSPLLQRCGFRRPKRSQPDNQTPHRRDQQQGCYHSQRITQRGRIVKDKVGGQRHYGRTETLADHIDKGQV